ncbi:MAG TPA: hypothetical protein PLQ35_05330 [bacterium]|nr:hypothetical protein [bacterium]HQL61697.1 hypothetical protein [bacterium]
MTDFEEAMGLPGLDDVFNRYFHLIDRILPHPTRKEEDVSDVLYTGLQDLVHIAPQAALPLQEFLRACDKFRSQQYALDPERIYTDMKNTWLHLVLLDTGWRDAVQHLLSYNLPSDLDKAEFIRLKPVAQKQPPSFTVEIKEKIQSVDDRKYALFETHLKKPFHLRTSYDVDHQIITVMENKPLMCNLAQHEGEELLHGKVPRWLRFLLESDVVEVIYIEYPVRSISVLAPRDVIAGILAIPSCPVEWRSNKTDSITHALQQVTQCLELGDGPFHVLLTRNVEEWFPFLNHYLSDIKARVCGMQKKCPSIKEDGTDILSHTFTRCLSLQQEGISRGHSEYEMLGHLFSKSNGADEREKEEHLIPHQIFVTEVSPRLGEELLVKIGDTEYLDCVVKELETIGISVVKRLQEFRDPETPELKKKKTMLGEMFGGLLALDENKSAGEYVAEFRRKGIQTWLDLSKAVIQITVRNLHVLREMFRMAVGRTSRVHARHWNWMRQNDANPNMAEQAFRYFLSLAITNQDRKVRELAMSGLLYLFYPLDAVADQELLGILDDEIAAAKVIRDLPESIEPPAEISKWALNCHANADQCLDMNIQERIEIHLRQYLSLLEEL